MLVLVGLQLAVHIVPTESLAAGVRRWIVLAETLAFYGLIVAFLWAEATRRGGSAKDLGLARFKVVRSLVAILGLMVVLLVTRQEYVTIAKMLGFSPPNVEQQLVGLFGKGVWGFILALVVTVVIAPIVEELFFRGFIYGVLRERMSAGWAILLSSAIFAAYHFNLWLVVPIVMLGIALAWLTEWQRSIWPAIICHALNNVLAVLVVYGVLLNR